MFLFIFTYGCAILPSYFSPPFDEFLSQCTLMHQYMIIGSGIVVIFLHLCYTSDVYQSREVGFIINSSIYKQDLGAAGAVRKFFPTMFTFVRFGQQVLIQNRCQIKYFIFNADTEFNSLPSAERIVKVSYLMFPKSLLLFCSIINPVTLNIIGSSREISAKIVQGCIVSLFFALYFYGV